MAINKKPFIMIAEDAEDTREILGRILRSIGYEVLEAADGKQAVELFRDKHPDLILMDLSMPLLDGYGAVRQIRQLKETGDVPIIAVSAHESADHRSKAFAVGFNEYLTKPIDFVRLETLIDQFLKAA